MRTKQARRTEVAPVTLPVQPHVIVPTAIYTPEVARAALGLTKGTIPREVRLGRLRISKRAGRYYLTGRWLLRWIEGGEVRSRRAATASSNGHDPDHEPEEGR